MVNSKISTLAVYATCFLSLRDGIVDHGIRHRDEKLGLPCVRSSLH